MIFTQYKIESSGSILAFTANEKRILFVDNNYGFFIYDRKSFEPIVKAKISSKFDSRHNYEKSFAITNKANMSISIPKNSNIYMLEFKNKIQKICDITHHQQPPSTTTFNHKGDVLAIGDEGGRVFLFSPETKRIVGSFKKKPDYISAISFSHDDTKIAISSFNLETMLYDFYSENYICEFETESVVEKSLFTSDGKYLLSLLRNNDFIKFELETKKISKLESIFKEWPTSIVEIGDKVAVGTKGEHLYLIDYEDMFLVDMVKLKNSGITSLYKETNHLFISYINGNIDVVDTAKYLEEVSLDLHLNNFEEASKLIKENILLKTFPIIKIYDEAWEQTLQTAKELIAQGERQDAINLVTPFFIDQRKEEEFLFCLGHIDDFKSFRENVKNNHYRKAFIQCDAKEFLKRTDEYNILDNYWQKTYRHSKLLLMTEDPVNIAKAKKLLLPFMNIPSKSEIVNNLLTKQNIFKLADLYIKTRNFKEYFILIQSNKFLEQDEVYNKVMKIGRQTFEKMKTLEYNDELDKALKVSELLLGFIPMRENVLEASQLIRIKKRLIKRIESNDIEGVYGLILSKPKLQSYEPFIEFHSTFQKVKESGLKMAYDGFPERCYNLLEPYVEVPFLFSTVSKIMKISFIEEFANLFYSQEKDEVDWVKSINSFLSMYGNDEEFLATFRSLKMDTYVDKDKLNFDGKTLSFFEIPMTSVFYK